MATGTSQVKKGIERAGELATEVISNAAGGVVDPKKGAAQLSSAVRRPAAGAVLVGLMLAYLLGLRRGVRSCRS